MAPAAAEADVDREPESDAATAGVSVHTTRPGRRVFMEEGNMDGWIATDLTVSLER